jgi:hypothetical protein
MTPFPESDAALVVRTDFSDERGWRAIRSRITSPLRIFRPEVQFVEERAYEGATADDLLRLIPGDTGHPLLALADAAAMTSPGHPLLIVDVNPYETRGATFRALPQKLNGIAANLGLGNMDFGDFSAAVGEDGVFRGFPWRRS